MNLNTKFLNNKPIWRDNNDPRNTIGSHVINDDRRTKQIEAARVGPKVNFLKMRDCFNPAEYRGNDYGDDE